MSSAKKQSTKVKTTFSGFAAIVIPVLFVTAVCVFTLVFGNPGNFQGHSNANQPMPGNYLGTIYKGGLIVPLLLTFLLMVITFGIERAITISRAKGKGNQAAFVAKVQQHLESDDLESAFTECDKQRGSLANVVKSALGKYKEMISVKDLSRDQKVMAIKQEVEESTSLELPMLEQNLVILSTLASVSTLFGLLGTVTGMIKAFAALANAGAPDAAALSTGISEALINTAFGISTSAIAIVLYNYFTTKIDKITYSIDEAGVSIEQNFAAKHN